MPGIYDPKPYTVMPTDTERLSDVVKLSAHVTRILGQNPGMMTLQGTNSYLLQPPSNPLAPIILIDTSSPHTADQYVDLLLTHLYSLGLNAGSRETHFESQDAKDSLAKYPEEKQEEYKASMAAERADNPRANESNLNEYGVVSGWSKTATQERRLSPVEHIVLTHRHLDHVGAVAALLDMLKSKGLPRPKIWKMLSPDETELGKDDRDRHTTDAAFVNGLPRDSYIPFQPLQPLHPLMPGLMLSVIDPEYKYLVEKDKVKWNDIPEICRVSVRCLKTPGHTADSVALVMCEGERGVFTGDTVLGQGTTIFTDLSAYMLSLKTLLALKPGVLYPAHGPHIKGHEASHAHIQKYITHRQDRENQILDVLKTAKNDPQYITKTLQELINKFEQDTIKHENYKEEFMTQVPARDGGLTLAQEKAKDEAKDKVMKGLEVEGGVKVVSLDNIARMIYRSKDEKLIFAAKKSLTAHLVKLVGEGKVKKGKGVNPVILDGEVKEPEDLDGYEVAEGEVKGE